VQFTCMDGAGKKASTKASMPSLGMLFLSASVSAAAGSDTGHAMHAFRMGRELGENFACCVSLSAQLPQSCSASCGNHDNGQLQGACCAAGWGLTA
jgi:hypothetical protein